MPGLARRAPVNVHRAPATGSLCWLATSPRRSAVRGRGGSCPAARSAKPSVTVAKTNPAEVIFFDTNQIGCVAIDVVSPFFQRPIPGRPVIPLDLTRLDAETIL